jgi:hypothetical protein
MACRSTSDLDTFLVRASCSRTRVVSESSRTLVGKVHLLQVYYVVYYAVARQPSSSSRKPSRPGPSIARKSAVPSGSFMGVGRYIIWLGAPQ